jgi:hypothetical protein
MDSAFTSICTPLQKSKLWKNALLIGSQWAQQEPVQVSELWWVSQRKHLIDMGMGVSRECEWKWSPKRTNEFYTEPEERQWDYKFAWYSNLSLPILCIAVVPVRQQTKCYNGAVETWGTHAITFNYHYHTIVHPFFLRKTALLVHKNYVFLNSLPTTSEAVHHLYLSNAESSSFLAQN